MHRTSKISHSWFIFLIFLFIFLHLLYICGELCPFCGKLTHHLPSIRKRTDKTCWAVLAWNLDRVVNAVWYCYTLNVTMSPCIVFGKVNRLPGTLIDRSWPLSAPPSHNVHCTHCTCKCFGESNKILVCSPETSGCWFSVGCAASQSRTAWSHEFHSGIILLLSWCNMFRNNVILSVGV